MALSVASASNVFEDDSITLWEDMADDRMLQNISGDEEMEGEDEPEESNRGQGRGQTRDRYRRAKKGKKGGKGRKGKKFNLAAY